MKRLKTYESFDFNEDDFNFEEEETEDNYSDIPENFKIFLSDKEVLDEYVECFNVSDWNDIGSFTLFFKNVEWYSYIDNAFSWQDTFNGYFYWAGINNLWQRTNGK